MAQITVSSQIQVLSLPGSQPGVSAPSIILSLEMVGAGVSKPDLGFCKHILASLPPYWGSLLGTQSRGLSFDLSAGPAGRG